jgi:hypothetical protein
LPLLAVLAIVVLCCKAQPTPTGDAEWIWADLPARTVTPQAFYAVRDFDLTGSDLTGNALRMADLRGADLRGLHSRKLPSLTGADLLGAELRVQADEEYVLHLNGRRVGSNRYRAGDPLDVYPVGDLLHPGANRLVAELRSARGYGGLLAALVDEGGEPLLVTDASWRVLRRHRPGLLEGRAVLTGSEPAHSWGRPPVGRWPVPTLGPSRPTTVECGSPCAPRPAVEATRVADWVHRFDFGEEVTGYVVLRRAPDPEAGLALGLVEVGMEPVNPMARPREALPLVGVVDGVEWSDVVARRFRYVTVAGLGDGVMAEVVPVDGAALALLPGGVVDVDEGLFGLQPHWRRNGVEGAVRRKLRGKR